MAQTIRQHADERILDLAAALFARRGVDRTSIQEIACAVGLSKAGLLHHFPSKDVLHQAVLTMALGAGDQLLDQVREMRPGTSRDLRAIEVLVDIATARPGLIAFLLSPVMQAESLGATETVGWKALEAFGVDNSTPAERTVRVAGALSALAVLSLTAYHQNLTITWRPHVVATCFDALGHRRPSASLSSNDQVEA